MKKLIFLGAMALIAGMIIISCQKEAANPGPTTVQNGETNNNSLNQKLKVAATVKRLKYTWVSAEKMDCVCCGDNCEVSAKIVSPTETIDLSVLQVLELIKIGNFDLNDYFVKNQNELRDIFPEVYEKSFVGDIASKKINLVFEFPYLWFYDGNGTSQSNLIQVINYEATLTDKDVIATLQAAAPVYDKVAQLNTDPNKPVVWICTNPGNNCATKKATAASSTFRFFPEWIRDNYQYLYVPTSEVISKATLTKDRTQIEITTDKNNIFVIEL